MRLGIDIGSTSLKLALLGPDGEVVFHFYTRTEGRPRAAFLRALDSLEIATGIREVEAASVTGSGKRLLAGRLAGTSEILAHATAVAAFHPGVRTAIEIGGQDSKLIRLDRHGRLAEHAFNELCAAGTGAFLDQQAARLGLTVEQLAELAARADAPVAIAGRCAVFAKSDMIHHQQAGVPPERVAAGLCFALAQNYLARMLRGHRPALPLAFLGGVARNGGVRRAFAELLKLGPSDWFLPAHHLEMGAIGAAMLGPAGQVALADLRARAIKPEEPAKSVGPARRQRSAPLWEGDPPVLPARPGTGGHFLGVDIGSVSTKGVLIDDAGEVVASHYTQTAGAPLQALGRVLEALKPCAGAIRASGVTGSGRLIAERALGADVVVDEISAQLRAVAAIDPAADTVFEIGGQDAKVLILKDGAVVDFALNRVCAAGTGSFLAEQAARLGLPGVEAIGPLALASQAPLALGARCTVFMDSDLIHHQQCGAALPDLLAGLCSSVVQNFLEQVVQRRPIGQRVWFQGGVAANPAVREAFEQKLGRPVRVHPHHALTGAWGAALLAQAARIEATAFVGFEQFRSDAQIHAIVCGHCENHCEVVRVEIGGQAPLAFGGGCDRHEQRADRALLEHRLRFVRAARDEIERPFRDQPADLPEDGAIGLPRALWPAALAPFFTAFLNALGRRVNPSARSNRALYRRGLDGVLSESCFAVKLSLGHVRDLLDRGAERVLLPSLAGLPTGPADRAALHRAMACTYVQALPDLARAGFGPERLLCPRLDLGRGPDAQTLDDFTQAFGSALGAHKRDIARALGLGFAAWHRHRRAMRRIGEQALAALDGPTAVLLGRPYQLHDPLLSFSLPTRLAAAGATVLTADILPLEGVPLDEQWQRLYWKANRDLLRAFAWLDQRPQLLPVLMTAFGCGPDGFSVRYAEQIRAGRPLLVLELDEHTAEAGLVTRIEAYLRNARPAPAPAVPKAIVKPYSARRRTPSGKKIYLPTFSDHAHIYRAVLVRAGMDAELLPLPSRASLERGRRHSTGRECNPFAYMLGDALTLLERPNFDASRSAIFLNDTEGPCLLSQFGPSFELALCDAGAPEIQIWTPHSSNFQKIFGLPNLILLWQGMVAMEVLAQITARLRPHERQPGAVERAHQESLLDLEGGVLQGALVPALRRSYERIKAAAGPADPERPRVLVVGDVYTRNNRAANANLHQRIEALGCTVTPTPFLTDQAFHDTGSNLARALARGLGRQAIEHTLLLATAFATGYGLERLAGIPRDTGLHYSRCSYWAVARGLQGRLCQQIDGNLSMNVAQALSAIRAGEADAVINAICHNCMIGTVSEALLKRLVDEPCAPPVATLSFDGLQATNIDTRLEALCAQAASASRARKAASFRA